MTIYCKNCDTPIKRGRKFCGSSCAAKFNNANRAPCKTGPSRMPRPSCLQCGKKVKQPHLKHCSVICSGKARTLHKTPHDKKMANRAHFMKYYMKRKAQTPPDADFDKIKEIYLNCPAGYEVDHIIPVSKGGLHHQDNLQYLTISENRRKSNSLNWPALRDSNSRPTE